MHQQNRNEKFLKFVVQFFSTSQLRTVFVKLLSTANTGYTYFTRKNPAKLTHKLFFRKFDPIIRQHVIFEERKK